MCSDVSRETNVFVANGAPQADPTCLAEELRRASAEYRSLALHAGALHCLTLEAKRRVEHIHARLCAEANFASFP